MVFFKVCSKRREQAFHTEKQWVFADFPDLAKSGTRSLAMMSIRPLCHLSGSYEQAAEYSLTTAERKSRQVRAKCTKISHQTTSWRSFRNRILRPMCLVNHRIGSRSCGYWWPRNRARGVRNFGPNVALGMSREQMLTRPMLRHSVGSLRLIAGHDDNDFGWRTTLNRRVPFSSRRLSRKEWRRWLRPANCGSQRQSLNFHRACRRTAFELPGRTSYQTVTKLWSSSSTVDG